MKAVARALSCLAMFSYALSASATNFLFTPFLTDLDVHMDNGRTFFTGSFTTQAPCLYNRINLGETGDYWNNVENGKRMYALILAARFAGKPIKLGYESGDGPECRLAEVYVQW